MAWVAVDDQFPEHDKVSGITDRAFRIHITGLCYCARNLTDGHLSARAVKVVCAIVEAPRPARYIEELVAARLWVVDEDAGDGYWINNYLEYNPSKEEVEENRAKARERMRRLREKHPGSGRSSPERSGEQTGNVLPNVREKFGDPLPSHPLGVGSKDESPTKDASGARFKQPAIVRLHAACGGGQDALRKLERTVRANKLNEGDVEYAIECATGPGVRDALSVALSELKKRGDRRAA